MRTLNKMKTIITSLFLITVLTSCSSDDGNDGASHPLSYTKFSIEGPIVNKNFEFRDVSLQDDFSTIGYLYTPQDEPELTENQIQLNIRKSLRENSFFVVAPAETGSHSFQYTGGSNDYEIDITLASIEENFYTKNTSITITELEFSRNKVKRCKGTFSGSFYLNDLTEDNVHQISGEFEINN